MKCIVKKPTGETMTVTLDSLAIRYENGVIKPDWPAILEHGAEWSTVGALLATHSPSQKTSPSATEAQPTFATSENHATSVCRRYQNAYLVAKATTSIGVAVKSIGIGLGVLVMISVTLLSSQTNMGAPGFMSGLIFGAVVAIPLYVLGILVSAQGEVLKATLDGAVNSSPFLKKEDMARIMSL